MSQSIYALHAALHEMEIGDVRAFSYPDMRTMDVMSEAKSFAARNGFSVKVSAGYQGVDVQKVRHTRKFNIERTLIAMANGEALDLKIEALEIPMVRELIHKINKTGAVHIDGIWNGKAMRVTRTDMDAHMPPCPYTFHEVKRCGSDVFAVPLKPAVRQKQFEKDLWMFALIAHQPMGSIRISDTEVQAYRR